MQSAIVDQNTHNPVDFIGSGLAAAVAVITIISASCVNVQVFELEHYSELSAKPPDATPPVMFFAEQAPLASLPFMVPYAVIGAGAGTDIPRDLVARKIWQKAAELNADVVIIEFAGSSYAGSVSQYLGFGISTATPVYANAYRGYCYKRASFRMGINVNKEGMVVACSNESKASGIIEGDTLLSVNNFPVQAEGNKSAPYLELATTIHPGDSLQLVWIRPGTGRMEGAMKALENPPTHVGLKSSIEWKPPPPQRRP